MLPKPRCYLLGLLLTAFLAVTTVSAPAFAQTDQEKAADLYKEGIDLYFAEDFGLAITKFRAGYQLDPNAMFLYSLSLCFSKLGNFSEALENAEQAKKTGGMPPDASTKNDARLVAFALLIQTESLSETMSKPKPDTTPTCATNDECGEGEVCNMRQGICVAELPPEKPAGKPLFTPVGWAGVGAGVVGIGMLVGGGVTSLAVKKNEDRYAEVSDPASDQFDADERDSLSSKLDSQKGLGRVLILGGGGLVVVGAGLVIVDMFVLNKDKDEKSATLVPLLYPGGAGVAWSLRF